jgi:hypothetical protein
MKNVMSDNEMKDYLFALLDSGHMSDCPCADCAIADAAVGAVRARLFHTEMFESVVAKVVAKVAA